MGKDLQEIPHPARESVRHSLRPSLSSGDCKESEQSPDDVVVVKLVPLPFSSLHLLLVFPVVNVVTPKAQEDRKKGNRDGKRHTGQTDTRKERNNV